MFLCVCINIYGTFEGLANLTVGCDIHSFQTTFRQHPVKVRIFDTAGQEHYYSLTCMGTKKKFF